LKGGHYLEDLELGGRKTLKLILDIECEGIKSNCDAQVRDWGLTPVITLLNI
jgi:hypothetical protein